MKEIGEKTVLGEPESLLTKMETTMKVSGSIIKPMEPEFTIVKMDVSMKEVGEEIYSMEKVRRLGKMAVIMMVNLRKARNKAMENIFGKTVIFMKENGKTINSTAKGFKDYTMGDSTKENGIKAVCMGEDITNGLMEKNMKASM